MTYALSDYQLTIDCNDPEMKRAIGSITIGGDGEQNALDTISVTYKDNLWETESYATGAWVHNKNLSRVGTIKLNLNMLSDYTGQLTTLTKYYYNAKSYKALTLTVTDRAGNNTMAYATDCFPEKLPDLSLQASAQMNEWTFTCGQIECY